MIEPRLTTYKQNTEDLGRLAARKLVEAIEEELFTDVNVLEHPQFTVAFGAACSLKQ